MSDQKPPGQKKPAPQNPSIKLDFFNGLLSRLEELRITGGIEITGAGLEYVEGMPGLKSLSLSGARITDAGFEHIVRLRNLEELSLSGTRVTDAELEDLKALTNLKRLDISHNRVTRKAVDELRAALPNCDIEPHYVPSPMLQSF
jgi:Leucine-rich repeat (LRR) protein